jgi:hypothetical protein
MLTKRFGILVAIATLPAVAQVANPARQHGPIRDRQDHQDGTVASSNWSGYAVKGSAFTSVEGSWIVPTATCPSGSQYASFWVGIDGYSSGTVEQTGTDSDCHDGKPHYYAWYEFYPQRGYTFPSQVIKPGDVMWAKVFYDGSEFTVVIKDLTSGRTSSKSATVPGAKRSSAEWIAEAPCCTAKGDILPLADFGTLLFGGDSTGLSSTNYATDSSTSGAIGSFPAVEEIIMEKPKLKVAKAVPSGLSSDGTSFSVNWAAK